MERHIRPYWQTTIKDVNIGIVNPDSLTRTAHHQFYRKELTARKAAAKRQTRTIRRHIEVDVYPAAIRREDGSHYRRWRLRVLRRNDCVHPFVGNGH